MLEKSNTHKSGFKIPKNYIEEVQKLIIAEKQFSSIPNTSGFFVPNAYFKTTKNKISSRVINSTPKIVRFPKRKIIAITSIAATIALFFLLQTTFKTEPYNTLNIANIETYLLEEELSNEELATLFLDIELNTENNYNTTIDDTELNNYINNHFDLDQLY